MTDRKTLIGKLAVGDFLHAEAPNGASVIGLVLSVNGNAIRARRVTTQEELTFDRTTGKQIDEKGFPCVIDSVAPLPPEIHEALLQLDEKNRLLMAMDEESRFADLGRLKLTEAAGKALSFVGKYYPANPLPPLQ